MMRFGMTLAAMVFAGDVAAQEWAVEMTVSGAASGVLEASGARQGLVGDAVGNFMSADAFAEGVTAGRTTCAKADLMEVDAFFGHETSLGGHLLFTLQRQGDGYRVIDPSMFADTLDANAEIIETYAAFGDVTVALNDMTCAANGMVSMDLTYKGRLLSEMGGGPDALAVIGTLTADFTLRDMNEY